VQQRLTSVASSSSSIVETFNIAHTLVVNRISSNPLIPATFNPQIEEFRGSKPTVLPPRQRDLLVTVAFLTIIALLDVKRSCRIVECI